MAYYVVEFVEKGQKAVIHSQWLTSDSIAAYWPPYENLGRVDKAVRQGEQVGAQWKKHQVRVMYETEDYNHARMKLLNLLQAEVVPNLDTTTGDGQGSIKREASDSGDESGPPKKVALSSCHNQPTPTAEVFPVPISPRQPAITPEVRPVAPNPRQSSITQDASPSPRQPSPTSCDGSERDARIFRILEEMREEIRKQGELLRMLVRQQNVATSNDVTYTWPESLPLPLHTVEDIEAAEAALENPAAEQALISQLSALGGFTIKECTKRMFAFVLGRELATKFNWCGKGTKRPFSVLKLKDVLFKALRANQTHKDATLAEFEVIGKEWLRMAYDRLGRRNR